MKFQSHLLTVALLLAGVQLGNLQAARPKAQEHIGIYKKDGRAIKNMSDTEFNGMSNAEIKELADLAITGTVKDKKASARAFITKKLGKGADFSDSNKLTAELVGKQNKKSTATSSRGGASSATTSTSSTSTGIVSSTDSAVSSTPSTTGAPAPASADEYPAIIRPSSEINNFDKLSATEKKEYQQMILCAQILEELNAKGEEFFKKNKKERELYNKTANELIELMEKHPEFIANTPASLTSWSNMGRMAGALALAYGTYVGIGKLASFALGYLPTAGELKPGYVKSALDMATGITTNYPTLTKYAQVGAAIAAVTGGAYLIYSNVFGRQLADHKGNVKDALEKINNNGSQLITAEKQNAKDTDEEVEKALNMKNKELGAKAIENIAKDAQSNGTTPSEGTLQKIYQWTKDNPGTTLGAAAVGLATLGGSIYAYNHGMHMPTIQGTKDTLYNWTLGWWYGSGSTPTPPAPTPNPTPTPNPAQELDNEYSNPWAEDSDTLLDKQNEWHMKLD